MDNKIYKQLKSEYEIKREKSLKNAKFKKYDIYAKVPEVEEYEKLINKKAIEITKKMIYLEENDKEKAIEIMNAEIFELRKKVNQILSVNGYKPDDLKPKFDCMICEDKGVIDTDHGNEFCKCYIQTAINRAFADSNLHRLKEENFSTFDFGYYSAKANKAEFNSNVSPQENIKDIKQNALNFVQNFSLEGEKNLLFTGSTGLGKTFLSNCIAKELLEKGYTVMYQTAPVLIDKIIEYKFAKDKTTEGFDFKREIQNVDLLIIDDLGIETASEYRYEEWFNIINARINNNKKMIISTNLSLKDLNEKYEERIVSRIIGEFTIYRFFGDDIRIVKKRINNK